MYFVLSHILCLLSENTLYCHMCCALCHRQYCVYFVFSHVLAVTYSKPLCVTCTFIVTCTCYHRQYCVVTHVCCHCVTGSTLCSLFCHMCCVCCHRQYCARRLRRIRKSLHFPQGYRNKVQPKKITEEILTDVRLGDCPCCMCVISSHRDTVTRAIFVWI